MFADLEYDHLDYSRPGSSWKPHYQRMANGLAPHSKDASSKDHSDSADWYSSFQQLVHAVRSMPMYKTLRLIGLYWLDQYNGWCQQYSNNWTVI
jgi:hypothetical protein